MVVGLLQLEVRLPAARSLKDKRSVMNSLTEQLRGRFNIAVAQLEPTDKWQRAVVGIAALAEDRSYVDGLLRRVADWVRESRLVELVRVEQELW
jgi:hypothetical protein